MKERAARALSRALAEWCVSGDGSLEDFISRAALGLYSESASDYASVAFIVRRLDGSTSVGLPRELESLPAETLLGLLVDDAGAKGACRVKDHALDAVRFIDSRFRTSIVARVRLPEACVAGGEGALWFGLSSSAASQQVNRAHLIADAVSEWFEVHGQVLTSFRGLKLKLTSEQDTLLEMRSLAHDARAPIAALQYLIADVVRAYPDILDEVCRLQEEISYVGRLLSNFTPRSDEVHEMQCWCPNVWAVIHRVCERFAPEAALKRCPLRIEGDTGSVCPVDMSALELERVLSNIIGNAVRYAEGGAVVVQCCRGTKGEVVVRVSDHGPGFSQETLDNFELATVSKGAMPGAHGWGLGLVSCRRALAAKGGECRLFNGAHGAIVEVFLPPVEITTARQHDIPGENVIDPPAHVRSSETPLRLEALCKEGLTDSECDPPCVLLIDDDIEHTASLERLLMRKGVKSVSFTDVESAFAALSYLNARGIVCDVQMPDGGSKLLLKLVAAAGLEVRVAVMSGDLGEDRLYELAALGASECFQKPIDHERLVRWALAIQGVAPQYALSRVVA